MNRTTNWTTAVMRATPKPAAAADEGLGFLAIMGIIAACSVVFCSFYFCFCERNCREQSGTGKPRQFKHRRAVISVDMMDPASYGNLV
jgi:hypothetical protein